MHNLLYDWDKYFPVVCDAVTGRYDKKTCGVTVNKILDSVLIQWPSIGEHWYDHIFYTQSFHPLHISLSEMLDA